MGKYLNGSSKTGTKISKNSSLFTYFPKGTEQLSNDSVLYKFEWNFDGQFGYANIAVKGNKISNSSLINTDAKSTHQFDRPLGLYNDPSLESIFRDMMASINIKIDGIYADTF